MFNKGKIVCDKCGSDHMVESSVGGENHDRTILCGNCGNIDYYTTDEYWTFKYKVDTQLAITLKEFKDLLKEV